MNRDNPYDFWETGPYPITLAIDYPEPQSITSYSLGTEDAVDRMPTAWRLDGSQDRLNWVPLDQRTDVSGWPNKGKGLAFAVDNPGIYPHYRFAFTAGAKRRFAHLPFRS